MLFVTGATGFVGRNLLRKFAGRNRKIRCLVRNNRKMDAGNDLEIVNGDLLDKDRLYTITQNVDTVIHLAAVINSADPEELMSVNVHGTRNLVEACVKNGVRKIIYVSSLDAVLDQTNFYGKTKAMGEEIIKKSCINYIILRPSFIYGKDSESIILLAKLIKKYPLIPVVGSGKGKLQPIYIDDVCETIIKLVDNSQKNKTYNIAGEQKISINDLIDKIAGIYSKRIFKIHVPVRLLWLPLRLRGLVMSNSLMNYESLRLLDNDKTCELSDIKKDLDFKPVSLDDGLKLALLN